MEVLILLIFTGSFAWWGFWVSQRGETKDPANRHRHSTDAGSESEH
jgi:hypothetical protein